jgi:shikimate kinase
VSVVDRHVVLLGLMGAGKTSIGTEVAARLGRPLIDSDERLFGRTAGRTAAEIETDCGLDHLHRLEAEIVLEALALADPAVIGPASSVCESATVRDALAEHLVVWLRAPLDYLARTAVTKTHRPLIDHEDPVALFARQTAVREPLILPLAALVIDVAELTVEEAAAEIVRLVDEQSA